MKSTFYLPFLVMIVALSWLPGCGRLYDWGRRTFYQGEDVDNNADVARCYIRSVAVYDQLETRAIFDAIWLSNEVRMAYADLHALRHGKTDEQKKSALWRQLEENNIYLSFYVLSLYEIPLGEEDSDWAVFLKVDDEHYFPIEVKSVELAPEYKYFMTKQFNRFKVPYSVKFNAKNVEDQPIITEQTRKITLVFRSASKEASLIWYLDKNGEATMPPCRVLDEPYTIREPLDCE